MADDSDASPRLTFPRTHRLKRKRLIRSLFDRSRDDVQTVAVGSIRLLYRTASTDEVGYDVPIQIGFAPGRRVSPGVERNRVRRLLREVYRVHQHLLVDLFVRRPDVLLVMALFRGDPNRADAISRDLPRAMQRLADRLSSPPPPAADPA
ncbi:ribonuclease P [Longibacter salinarum]|uniref:Ribonuclease P protein component n=1 Tax=Longibacter salinarum TaxID=1850348 RepID=A0A2A8CV13_9BACT|nr:ribonuclease P protein component [Longibacter salinarum]PEN12343.1 ribonuclease P [Longibacter salinarum]